MNRQITKALKSGIFAGLIAAIIGMIISAAITKYLGQGLDPVALILGGATIGSVTLVLTVIISSIIGAYKQKLQKN